MEFRRPQEDTTPTPSSLPYNPPPIRASAFSKPLLPPTASLLTPIPSPKPNGLNPTPPDPIPDPISSSPPKYRECLRNHAATLGGHVLDGCGEFMPDLTNPLQCAACSCHRSFHRKETEQQDHNHNYYTHNPRNPIPRLLLPPPLHTPYNLLTPSGSGGATTESSSEENRPGTGAAPAATATAAPPGAAARKRFRSKFTTEQKKRMMGFAESVGWRFQKQDEAAVEQFCAEVGVRRQVFKVWMHNNKHIIRRQQQELMHLQDQPQQPEQQQQELKQ